MRLKKTLFMLKKFRIDLQAPRDRYRLCDDWQSSNLGDYYFLFDEERVAAGQDQKLIHSFDADGIPINKTYIDVADQELVYFPISIGQLGLAVYHTWLKTNRANDRDRFLKFVAWFYRHADLSDAGARWLTEVALPQYHNPGPWASAFAQSRGLSILLRGFQLTGETRYAELATRALIPFTRPVAEGGVTVFTEYGPFYEEYTATVPTLVLNGMIFSLCGLLDYRRVFPADPLGRQLYNDGVATLKAILPQYDLGYWSRYNLCQAEWYPAIDPATIAYHRLHITQLQLLSRWTNDPVFKEWENRFRRYDTVANALKMYHTKFRSLKQLNRL